MIGQGLNQIKQNSEYMGGAYKEWPPLSSTPSFDGFNLKTPCKVHVLWFLVYYGRAETQGAQALPSSALQDLHDADDQDQTHLCDRHPE